MWRGFREGAEDGDVILQEGIKVRRKGRKEEGIRIGEKNKVGRHGE